MMRFIHKHYHPFGLKADKKGKQYVRLYVLNPELEQNVDHYRLFRLRNFVPDKKFIAKILDNYDLPECD
jgi:hypothetical protein